MISLKKRNLNYLLVFVWLLISHTLVGQRFQFSQYNITPLRVNPAKVAASNFADFNLVYRNQSTAGDFNISSSYASYHRPFFTRRSKLRWAGFGISALDDRAGGSALLSNQSVGMTGGINIQTARKQSLSLGASIHFRTSATSLSGLTTGSQYVPGRGIVPTENINEDFGILSLSTVRFDAGILWQEVDRFLQPVKYIGISFADINRPDEALLINNMFKIPASTMVQAGFQLFDKSNFSATAEILYTGSAATHALNFGLVWRLKLEENRRSKDYTNIAIHTKYLIDGYGILAVQWEQPKFNFGASYDISFGAVRAANAGAVEVSLCYKNLIIPQRKKTNPYRNQTEKVKVKKKRKKKKRRRRKKGKKRRPGKEKIKEVLVEKETEPAIELPAKEEAVEQKEVLVEKPKITEPVIPLPPGIEVKEAVKEELEMPIAESRDTIAVASATKSFDANNEVEVGRLIYRSSEIEKGSIAYEFEFNKIEPSASFKQYLAGLADLLKQDEFLNIEIIGHTDAVGSADYNQRLSEQRADAALQYLLKLGIAPERMQAIGRGEAEPVSATSSHQENRRVEIWILTNQ